MTRRNKDLGDWGESQACGFLKRQGFKVVERNFHTTTGEIDIVAERGGDYYFVEVKTRRAGELASDLAVTPEKRRRFKKAVRVYCYRRNIGETGIVMAGLLVVVDPLAKKAFFRLAVFADS